MNIIIAFTFCSTDGFFDIVYNTNAYFGEGDGTIHLNLLGCSGSEYRLVDCDTDHYVESHRYDWSLTCKNGAAVILIKRALLSSN